MNRLFSSGLGNWLMYSDSGRTMSYEKVWLKRRQRIYIVYDVGSVFLVVRFVGPERVKETDTRRIEFPVLWRKNERTELFGVDIKFRIEFHSTWDSCEGLWDSIQKGKEENLQSWNKDGEFNYRFMSKGGHEGCCTRKSYLPGK